MSLQRSKNIAQPGVLRRASSMQAGDDFQARFLLQMCQIRDCVIPREEQLKYDQIYSPIYQNLTEAKHVREQCEILIENHITAIKKGADGKYHGHQIDIMNPIDDLLNIYFKDFYIRGAIACESLITLTRYLGYSIGFLFSDDDKKRRTGLLSFPLNGDDERFKILSEMISAHKGDWYIQFKDLRNKIEHQGWKLPQLSYRINTNGNVDVYLPMLGMQSLQDTLDICWENLTAFCEEVLVYIMSLKLEDELMMTYILPEQRDPILPVRYVVRHRAFPDAKYSCN